jgi:hypothetical protein
MKECPLLLILFSISPFKSQNFLGSKSVSHSRFSILIFKGSVWGKSGKILPLFKARMRPELKINVLKQLVINDQIFGSLFADFIETKG